jgi:hypothetical protein
MRIIYQTEEGLAVLIPTGELPIEDVARKDVPAGVDYWIVEDSEVPSDRTFRNAWELDANIGTHDGQGIGAEAWFAEQAEKEVEDENPS